MPSEEKLMNLNVERLSVSFGEARIVQEVSLRVQNKQFVGLIGPNGCGKSTLLKSIYKVIKPRQERSSFLSLM